MYFWLEMFILYSTRCSIAQIPKYPNIQISKYHILR